MINELPRDIMQVELGQLIPLDSSVGNEKLTNNIRLVESWRRCHGPRICRWQNGQWKGILDPSRVGSKRQDINHGC